MKIGLFLGNMSPTDGGAYTLLIDQLSALRRMHLNSEHEIILLHDQTGAGLAAQFSEFSSLNIGAAKYQVGTQEELDEILAREAAEVARAEAATQARDLAWQQQIEEFEQRFQRLRRVSDFLGRLYKALYRPVRPVPVVEAVPEPDLSPVAAQPWQKTVYDREGIQFIVYLAPWLGDIVMDIPYAVIVWDLQHRQSPWFPEVSSDTEWDRREQNYAVMLRRAALIYTGTEQGRSELARYYQIDIQRITVLPFATPSFALDAGSVVEGEEFAKVANLPANYLFYPAQFWGHKNHVVILEACQIIRQETDWDIGIVFTGADKGNLDYVKEYARRLGLQSCTRFLGFIDQADVPGLYRGAICLAFPTFFGPDNLPPLEAFGLGCPVVASNVLGAPEQLGDAAILVSPTDARAWAEAILRLRDVDTRNHFIAAGREAAAKLTWDDYARKMIESVDNFAVIRRTWR